MRDSMPKQRTLIARVPCTLLLKKTSTCKSKLCVHKRKTSASRNGIPKKQPIYCRNNTTLALHHLYILCHFPCYLGAQKLQWQCLYSVCLFHFRSVFGSNLVHRVNSCTVGISKCVFTFTRACPLSC